ncbi:hypothetical protein EYF80_009377 [Liparis tanakae]|uniref:Uncharacterized protein n=1 Tax=Liparis tanakae TaxID=230148 RepID=A0A4Z2IT51_9TELE|nr:hypothetical protein EYF80_009377 [Liparis tanakae]
MSDCVADWGRGSLVAPSRVGGPQICDECCIVNKTPEYPRSRLELESLSWHVGGVEAVSSTLDGLWDQAGVFINLNEKTRQPGVNMTQAKDRRSKTRGFPLHHKTTFSITQDIAQAIENNLHNLGILHCQQVAEWRDHLLLDQRHQMRDDARVDDHLDLLIPSVRQGPDGLFAHILVRRVKQPQEQRHSVYTKETDRQRSCERASQDLESYTTELQYH